MRRACFNTRGCYTLTHSASTVLVHCQHIRPANSAIYFLKSKQYVKLQPHPEAQDRQHHMHHRPQGTVFRQEILTVAPTVLSCGHPQGHTQARQDGFHQHTGRGCSRVVEPSFCEGSGPDSATPLSRSLVLLSALVSSFGLCPLSPRALCY